MQFIRLQTRNPSYSILLGLLVVFSFLNTKAQTLTWSAGGITSQWGLNCAIIGQNYGEVMLSSYASWLHYSDYSAPKTGDGSYVSLTMSIPGLNCNPDSSVGFIPELFLPPGAMLNITNNTPIRCFYEIQGQSRTQFQGTQLGVMSTQGTGLRVGPICPDGLGGGVGTPFLMGSATGLNGGLAMATQYLPRSSMLEIQVPVRFTNPLNSTSDKVQFATYSSVLYDNYISGSGQFSGNGTALHEVPILVGYRPFLANYQSSNLTSSSAKVSADLSSFYTAGTAYIDYGTTTSYGSSVTIGTVPNTAETFNVYADLTGLSASTTYNWRIRFMTAQGTFSGNNQTFTTTSGSSSFALTINKSGTGSGTITSSPVGIDCGSTCSANLAQGTSVTLTATVSAGSSFAGWSGDCTGTGTCNVIMNAAKNVTAIFNTATTTAYTLIVNKTGTGSGSVSSSPAGINCGLTCSASFNTGTSVTLTPTAASGSRFSGWSGACTGSGICTVTLNAAATISATFLREIGSLSMTLNGLPAGTTVSAGLTGPDGYNTTRTLVTGTSQGLSDVLTGAYTLTVPNITIGTTTYVPNATSQTVNVTFGATATINVTYAAATTPTYLLTANKSGTGAGVISSNPVGISCGSTCTARFTQNAVVTLTTSAASGSTFAGWSGACTGTGNCNVTMDAAKTVTATFNTAPSGTLVLTVTKAGTGQGTVMSLPSGLNCGSSCSASFATGSSVTLSVTPATGSSFTGWRGACTGASSCTVTIDAVKAVTATFQSSSAPIKVSAAKVIDLPTNTSAAKGNSKIPLLSFALAGDVKLSSLTLKATGTGNDALDLSAVKLVLDTNGNGKADAGETVLAQGAFTANDGEMILSLASPQTLTSSDALLVTVDVNKTLAALPVMSLLGLTTLAFIKRKRVRALLCVTLIPLIVAGKCNDTPPSDVRTYQVTLKSIVATSSAASSLEVTGLPLEGTTLVINP